MHVIVKQLAIIFHLLGAVQTHGTKHVARTHDFISLLPECVTLLFTWLAIAHATRSLIAYFAISPEHCFNRDAGKALKTRYIYTHPTTLYCNTIKKKLQYLCYLDRARYTHLNTSPVLQYLRYLEKGQIPPASLSLTSFQRDLMLHGDKYAVTASRTAPDQLRVSLNGSHVDVVARKLSDGGLLFQVDGSLHVVHAEEEASGTRLTIDNLTCLLENEHDPSCLTASSPGKLVRCAHLVSQNTSLRATVLSGCSVVPVSSFGAHTLPLS